ncbi:MAG: ligand-binding sensor domain-containing protein [Patiriisocius sp.]|jgi:ligand-binding sensor domain-containing protein
MVKLDQQLIVILFLIFFTSCEGQVKRDSSINIKEQKVQKEKVNSDVDEYFVESNDDSSPYAPSSITRNILEDKNGHIWFASWEGIIRYDGKSFVNFTNKEKLRRYHVFSLLEDRNGMLWFGTIGAGVYRYDGKSFVNFTMKEGLPDDRVTCIYEDKKGDIWFGTTGGASRYDGETFRNYTSKEGMSNHDINSIIEDSNGSFWFGTRGQACKFDPVRKSSEGDEKFEVIINHEGKSFNNVRSIIKDKMGDIWLGGNDGLWRYDGRSYVNYTTDFVGYIYEDKKGNIWTNSAKDGNEMRWRLSRYDAQLPSREKMNSKLVKEENDMFFGITEDSNGNIWLGKGYGIYRYDGEFFEEFSK